MEEMKTRVNLLTDEEYEVIRLYRMARKTDTMKEKLKRVEEFHKSLAEQGRQQGAKD